MRRTFYQFLFLFPLFFQGLVCQGDQQPPGTQKTIYEFKVAGLMGDTIDFSDYKEKKILIVNTASKCGYTGQYAELQQLHEKYSEELIIVGFPANNFLWQEPGNNEEIQEFCKKNYGVTFLMAEKIAVKGKDIHPIFRWLNGQECIDFMGETKWNFEKYLIDENGKLSRRFRSEIVPLDEEIIKAIIL